MHCVQKLLLLATFTNRNLDNIPKECVQYPILDNRVFQKYELRGFAKRSFARSQSLADKMARLTEEGFKIPADGI
ncbi:hypothetical protein CEXT_633411 [Caerostris extrusa]|uniref:Uncharacterized protein n=1 Tax=Caerostris extrusa TaxID=172846 RepID=A0AAV4SZY9_CAEEX|nr:hypothetical protein CEXT_633411 [Caerostris extrusa]